jgi:hypothetical protein
MSTATADNADSVRIPGWLWTGGVLVALGSCLLGITTWVIAGLAAANASNNTQENQLVNHEVRITSTEKAIERIETKLDKILDRLESK